MVADPQIVRLEIVKVVVPTASRNSLTSDEIINACCMLEKYVVGCEPSDERKPDSSPRGTLKLPRKEKQAERLPEFMTPPSVDKSNQASGT